RSALLVRGRETDARSRGATFSIWSSQTRVAALHLTPAAHQVNDQHHQRNHQQQVNQTAGYVEAETKKPQNQKHNENCPEHVDLLRAVECPESKGSQKL